MILIIESGATKTDWRAVREDGTVLSVTTGGMNLSTMSEEHIENALEEALKTLGREPVGEIHVYAAGLLPGASPLLESRLRNAFPGAGAEYCSDLMAAARALFGREEGIACILGTGSNSCLYDGEKIVRSIHSAGFILGDEGSASRLGRLFISDFLKDLVPGEIADELDRDRDVSYPTVVKNVYKGGAGAAYLGSFAPFILSHYDDSEYVKDLVDNNFRDFFERCLIHYGRADLRAGIVGGFAFACRETISRIAGEYGIKLSGIVPSPVEGLVKYHSI